MFQTKYQKRKQCNTVYYYIFLKIRAYCFWYVTGVSHMKHRMATMEEKQS
jgi:hypothetical protein